jgi:hypothetical protein
MMALRPRDIRQRIRPALEAYGQSPRFAARWEARVREVDCYLTVIKDLCAEDGWLRHEVRALVNTWAPDPPLPGGLTLDAALRELDGRED